MCKQQHAAANQPHSLPTNKQKNAHTYQKRVAAKQQDEQDNAGAPRVGERAVIGGAVEVVHHLGRDKQRGADLAGWRRVAPGRVLGKGKVGELDQGQLVGREREQRVGELDVARHLALLF